MTEVPNVHTYKHVHAHRQTHAHMHACTHVHTHVHTHIQTNPWLYMYVWLITNIFFLKNNTFLNNSFASTHKLYYYRYRSFKHDNTEYIYGYWQSLTPTDNSSDNIPPTHLCYCHYGIYSTVKCLNFSSWFFLCKQSNYVVFCSKVSL